MAADEAMVAALESQAIDTSEAWDTVVTDWIDPETVAAAETKFDGRADVGFFKVGGFPGAKRRRFIFTNPELLDSMTQTEVCTEHSVLLRVEAAFDKSGNKFGNAGKNIPNLLAGIGVEFDQIGDVLIDGDDVAYIACSPGATRKSIERLLPKSLGRASVQATEVGYKPEGTLVEMVVGRVDKRK